MLFMRVAIKRLIASLSIIALIVGAEGFAGFIALGFAANPPVNGAAVIRGRAGTSEIVITTTPRLAGAIHSLTWNGQEFIDSADHGRQLQSASNFDLGTRFTPETFNPTEAGSRNDGAGPVSSSRLLHCVTTPNSLQTTTQMAFWLLPGQTSEGELAKNTEVLSNHLLTKRVTIGYRQIPHVIQFHVTFSVPLGEHHKYAQFEAVTGYMPAQFETFWKFNPQSKELESLTDGPGEQAWPVILATKSGQHAMGVFSPDQPSPGFTTAGYGRFRFPEAKVVKWNSVFRIQNTEQGIQPGEYTFRNFVIIGDVKLVTQALRDLTQEFAER
ncbi:MAG: hypothetical protein JWM11_445 [Planctomycetaceae bacterium]|nr:hypothetical protein [Planctomycetaceae bacterium]